MDKLEPKECLLLQYSLLLFHHSNELPLHPWLESESSEEDFLVFLTYCLDLQFAEKEVANIKKEVASKLNLEKNEEVKKEETTTSTDDKKEEASTNSSSSSKTTSSEGSSSSSSSSSGSSEATKPSEKPSEPVKKHTHTWVDITEEVVHPEEGHWEEVVITPEQVKEVPVYERKNVSICNGCGADITNDLDHLEREMLKGNMKCSGYHGEWREVQTGTKKEVIPAVTEKRWIVDKPAWTETKVVGRKCKECGANE